MRMAESAATDKHASAPPDIDLAVHRAEAALRCRTAELDRQRNISPRAAGCFSWAAAALWCGRPYFRTSQAAPERLADLLPLQPSELPRLERFQHHARMIERSVRTHWDRRSMMAAALGIWMLERRGQFAR